MPEYLSPGVYVEEIDAGPKPIAPVATSTAGVVGVTRRGPATADARHQLRRLRPHLRRTGRPSPNETTRSAWDRAGRWWNAAESVKAFFDEGGARLFFQRVQPSGAAASSRGLQRGGVRAARQRRGQRLADHHAQPRRSPWPPVTACDLVSAEDGSTLGTVTVAAVDYRTRTVTLTADAGVTARSGRDLARIIRGRHRPQHRDGDRRQRRRLGRRPGGPGAARSVPG